MGCAGGRDQAHGWRGCGSSLVVRPASALMSVPIAQMDPLAIGHKLLAQFVLTGSFFRSEKGFDLDWQLLDVPGEESVKGGRSSISVPSFDSGRSTERGICARFLRPCWGLGRSFVQAAPTSAQREALADTSSEDYLQARAMLSSFMQRTSAKADLDRAREFFEKVVENDPNFAPRGSGLGITHLQYVRYGFGGQMHVMAARRAFDQALEIDPGSVEAGTCTAFICCCRAARKRARVMASNICC